MSHRALAVTALCTALAVAGCAAPVESPEALAERYAREETRLIDDQAFRQARERSRLRRDARARATVESAPPLAVDFAITGRWQFGTLAHPVDGTPVCAAVSGVGEPVPPEGAPTPRLVLLSGAAFVTSDVPLAANDPESAARIDSGLPIPLDGMDGRERLATLRILQTQLLGRLRGARLVSIAVVTDDPTASRPTDRSAVIERVFDLDGLGPMLDELERCVPAGTS